MCVMFDVDPTCDLKCACGERNVNIVDGSYDDFCGLASKWL